MNDFPTEWTQEQYLKEKLRLKKAGIKVLLIDTILNPIEKAETQVYNPVLLKEETPGTVFVFYCDTGKATKERLSEFQKRFPNNPCISLKGGRGYWRKNMMVVEDNNVE